jgi:competence protein ComEA
MASHHSDPEDDPVVPGEGDDAGEGERAVLGRRLGAAIVILASIVATTISLLNDFAWLPGAPGQVERDAATARERARDSARVDLNSADEATLALLPGIGTLKARRIIDERERNGDFADADDLRRVPGIGDKTIEALRPIVRATPRSAPPVPPTPPAPPGP